MINIPKSYLSFERPSLLNFKIILSLVFICILSFFSCSGKKLNRDKNLDNYLDSIVQSHCVFILSFANSEQVLDLYRGSKEDNAVVNGYALNAGPNQLWQLEKVEKGFIIRSNNSHKILTADLENSQLVQKDYNENDNQLWIISGSVDSVSIINKAFNKNLTLKYDKVVFQSNPQTATKYWRIKLLQKIQEELRSCNCTENLQFIKHLVETSYSGFQDKVNSETTDQYKRLRQLSSEEAQKTNNPPKCYKIIRDYILFFNDNHLQFQMNYIPSTDKMGADDIRKYYAGSEFVNTSDKRIKDYLDSNSQRISELEGIWESKEGEYRCAIIQDSLNENRFLGIILKADSIYWMPGQVKMDFRKQPNDRYLLYYASQNHTIVEDRNIEIIGDTLFVGAGKWIKKYPHHSGTITKKRMSLPQNAAWFQLKNLDDSTLLLSLPSFANNNKSIVDNLINSNTDKLSHCPYLIIDIRGNGGGDDNTFSSVLPFIYTHPFEIDGTDILSSKENIAFMELQIIHSEDNNTKEWLKSVVQRMKESPGKFVPRTNIHIFQIHTVLSYPRKIGILMNGGCASSAEQFLLIGKESKKVTLFGQPTSGTLDYSNLRMVDKCPSYSFKFSYPLTRSKWLPYYSIDKEKIKPDVYLSNDKNWMEEAIRHLKKD